jgi:hypothetical protein
MSGKEKQPEQNQEEKLRERKNSRLTRLRIIGRVYYLNLAVGLVLVSLGLGLLGADLLFPTSWRPYPQITSPWCLIFFIFGAMAVIAATSIGRAKLESLKEEVQNIEFEIDLLKLKATPEESRAEKLLRMNQYQLRRYYDLNLSQNKWIFAVGVLCIFLGVGIVGVTLSLLVPFSDKSAEWVEKALVGLVGAIGAILTNYVARIYLGMYSEIADNLAKFHSKLISTHNSFLANLLASRIDNAKKREDVLADLALAMQRSVGNEIGDRHGQI